MKLKDFKNELRLLLPSDEWEVAVDAWFECAGHLWLRGEHIPYEWKYSPGATDDPTEPDSYFHELFETADTNELFDIGAFLFRYCQYLKYKGLNY